MIITREENGQFVKRLGSNMEGTYGLHTLFGLIPDTEVEKRYLSRKRRGYLDDRKRAWEFLFEIEKSKDEKISLKALENCTVEKANDENWRIATARGSFLLSTANDVKNLSHIVDEEKVEDDIARSFALSSLFLMMIFGGLLWNAQNPKEVEKVVKPITVKMVEMKHEIVKIRGPKVQVKKKVITQKQKAHRAIKQNLGFLGLLGKKNLKKAIGGNPIKLKRVTAGAGKGGDQGSGGELLVGLGKAVKRTTIGNTGTRGLGGIGTKGAGGGAGGYGTTSIASGEGEGISAVAVSNEVAVEGGLSRGVIMATIQKYLAQIKACYNQGLKTKPGLEGTVTMDFRIMGTGRLQYAKVGASSLGSKMVENCMATKMLSWQFPKPKGEVSQDVRFPFSLRPENI